MAESESIRYQWIDAWRGLAVVMMIAYHFCYDLNYLQIVGFDFYHDSFWLMARTVIVSQFLFLVGISLQLSARRGLSNAQFRHAFGRRLFWLVSCALLVSLSSYIFSPSRWIFFGILHLISVASILGLCFIAYPRFSLWLGLVLILLANNVSAAFFDQPIWQWLGMMTHKPFTEDYVPLLPWFGVVLIGMYCGHSWFIARQRVPQAPPKIKAVTPLAIMGRHGLLIYMLHQPVMLGILMLIVNK